MLGTETADDEHRLEAAPGATRTEGTEIEIVIGDLDPEKVIGADPVQEAVIEVGRTRGTTAGREATAETETEEEVIAFLGPGRQEPIVDLAMTLIDGMRHVARKEPSRPPAETGTTAEPSAKPAQVAGSTRMELSCPGSWTNLVMTITLEALVTTCVTRTFRGPHRL